MHIYIMSQKLCESFMKIHQGVQEEMRIRDGYPLVVQLLTPCFALGNPQNHFDRLLKQQMHIYIMSQRLCESFMKIHQGVQEEMRIRDVYPFVVQWLSPCFALGNPKNHFDRLLKQQMHINIMQGSHSFFRLKFKGFSRVFQGFSPVFKDDFNPITGHGRMINPNH